MTGAAGPAARGGGPGRLAGLEGVLRARVVVRAQRLVEAGHYAAASRLVRPLVAGRDPGRTTPDVVLADAAIVYVQSCDDGHDHDVNVPWTRYAQDTGRRVRAPLHPRTLAATALLAETRERRQEYALAGRVWQSLAADYGQLEQAGQADQARTRQAVCLHALGRCGEAVRRAGDCWQRWCRRKDGAPGVGAQIAGLYLTMLSLCGRRAEALMIEAAVVKALPPWCGPGTLLFLAAGGGPDSFEPAAHDRVCARSRRPGDGPIGS